MTGDGDTTPRESSTGPAVETMGQENSRVEDEPQEPEKRPGKRRHKKQRRSEPKENGEPSSIGNMEGIGNNQDALQHGDNNDDISGGGAGTGESEQHLVANKAKMKKSVIGIKKPRKELQEVNENDGNTPEETQDEVDETSKKSPNQSKKKGSSTNRQTLQEEESAQALLALNKGDNEGQKDDVPSAEGENHDVEMNDVTSSSTVPADAKSSSTLNINPGNTPTSTLANTNNSVPTATMASAFADYHPQSSTDSALPAHIINQHLTAHMSKMGNAQFPNNSPTLHDELEQRLASGLQQNGFGPGPNVLSPPSPDNSVMPQQTDANGATKKQRKRKRDSADTNSLMVDPALMELDGAVPGVNGGDADLSGEGSEALPKKTPGRRKAAPNKAMTNNGTPEGTFSVEERFAIDRALEQYQTSHNMSKEEIASRVWGNQRVKDDFWDCICAAVPQRNRASVYKHVRRTYHVFEMRAKWTDEDDEKLAELVKTKGNKWKDIGDEMGRMGEDCRDRYRNYVKCGKTRGKDRWTQDEEDLLKKVVAEHKERAKADREQKGEPLPEDEDELVNWTTVSDSMDNIRSRIQCRYKWKKMQATKVKVATAPLNISYAGGKRKKLSFDINQMLPGDQYWLLTQIRDSGAQAENEIPWDQIAKNDKPLSIWNQKDLKAAYKRFRGHLPHRRRPLSEIVRQLLDDLEKLPPNVKNTRYLPVNGQQQQQQQQVDHISPGASSQHSPAPQPQNFNNNQFYITSPQSHQQPQGVNNMAPVANMGGSPPPQSAPQAPMGQAANNQPSDDNLMVDPELMNGAMGGEGSIQDLVKTAGEAIGYTNGIAAAVMAATTNTQNSAAAREQQDPRPNQQADNGQSSQSGVDEAELRRILEGQS